MERALLQGERESEVSRLRQEQEVAQQLQEKLSSLDASIRKERDKVSPWHGRPAAGCAGPSPLLPNRTLRCGVEELLRARTAGAAVPLPATGPAAAPRQGSSGTWGAFWRILAAGNGTGGLLRGAPVSRGSAGRLPQAAPARSEGLALPFPSLACPGWGAVLGSDSPSLPPARATPAWPRLPLQRSARWRGAGKSQRAFQSSWWLRRGSWPPAPESSVVQLPP